MNDLYYNLILVVIIIVLFLSLILIAYFYNSYTNNKATVKDNLYETKDYVNDTTRILDENIKMSYDDNNKRIDKLDDKYKAINRDLTKNVNTNTTDINRLKTGIQDNNDRMTSNLNKFDKNMKQYFEFRSSGSIINDSIYNYTFSAVPNLSMNLITDITALSGMTIKTDDKLGKNMRICDEGVNQINCIDMSITDGTFNIKPSPVTSNNVNTINIKGRDESKIANIDLVNNNIYLGGDKDTAGMMVNKDNIYVKKLNFMNPASSFTDEKVYVDKSKILKNQPQALNANTYEFNIYDTKMHKDPADILITIPCNYLIQASTGDKYKIYITLTVPYKPFKIYGIERNKVIQIPVYQLANMKVDEIPLDNKDITSLSKIGDIKLKEKIIKITTLDNLNFGDVINIELESADLTIMEKYKTVNPLFTSFDAYIVDM